jgi:gamma-glutamylcyclotransferase (GGCT)/AIG2-like uncharacterized protein YtfP
MYPVLILGIIIIGLLCWSEYNIRKYTLYFAYGSNTNSAYFKKRIPSAKLKGKAYLEDYSFKWYRHADIVPKKASKVEGVLWQIPTEDMHKLDKDEENYTREKVVVYTNRPLKAETYDMKIIEPKKPSKRYKRIIEKGYLENDLDVKQLED